jgi:predicted tellurium resistance membrane protein TerC
LLINITGIKDNIILNYSVRDIVLLLGGMFLLWKAIREIHHTIEFIGEEDVQVTEGHSGLSRVILDIVILDIVFSLDSVITAIGLTRSLWIIILAVMLSFMVVLIFAKPIGDFILKKPSIKILALSFLITIGITLFMEGLHQHVPRGYIYLPMGFAIMVELLQMRYEYNKNKIKTEKKMLG